MSLEGKYSINLTNSIRPMNYLVRHSNGHVSPCDEQAALQHLEEQSNCYITKFGTNHWIRGQTFLEYGDLGFESREFRVLLSEPHTAQADLLITTETFPPYAIGARLGVVVAERVVGINILKDIAVGFSDLIGRSSNTLQGEMSKARKDVIADLKGQAASMGAHGLIAFNLTYSPFEGKNTMMIMVAGWATAVTFTEETAC
jgi:uncharacterized protein YbjQ (UPF0145 family)